MRHGFAILLMIGASATALLSNAGEIPPQVTPEEQTLLAAGLTADGDALVEFFRERNQSSADLDKLVALARLLGDANAQTRANAAAKLVAAGPWAVPALRHVANELDNPLAAQQARHCLQWVEGSRAKEVPIAAAKLLAARKPAVAAKTLLAFLPRADDQSVVDAVKAALAGIAARPGKTDPALLAALHDPLPLRRAVAVEVLANSGHSELLPEVRKLLADAKPQVRLRVALALAQGNDEKAVDVLIDLLADLPADQRRLAEQALHQLAGEWSPAPALQGDDALSRKVRHEAWAGWWRAMNGPILLAVLRQHIASENVDPEKSSSPSPSPSPSPSALPRLLAVRKPAGAAEGLMAFLAVAKDRAMQFEIGKALKSLAMVDGQPDPALLKALSDPLPVRRIAAAEAIAGAGGAGHPMIRKLLEDGDPEIRLRVVMALVHAQDREAVPALIDLVTVLPGTQTLEADQLLRRLAGVNAPPIPPGDDAAARKKLGEDWQAWWKVHGATVNLAEPEKTPVVSNFTMIAVTANLGKLKGGKKAGGPGAVLPVPAVQPAGVMKPGAGNDRVIAVDRAGKTLWQIEGLDYPMDIQMLPSGNVLIAEYLAQRVTERDTTGKIIWQAANLPGAPTNVQRLANGNTFVALYNNANLGGIVMEFDKAGKKVTSINVGRGPGPIQAGPGVVGADGLLIAAHKADDGRMICLLTSDTCLWLDAAGKEINRYRVAGVNVGGVITREGNLDVTTKGHILVLQSQSIVVEYDPAGKAVWHANITGNRATRLANGNTLIASEMTGVVELDNTGKTVWQYQPPPGFVAVRAR